MSIAAALTGQNNPFPGLRPFREDEEYLFFGRESQIDAMVNKLANTHFLAVVGTSGSGKSSLVNCGLRPALHGGLMARAGTAWRMAQFRPGGNPMRAMANALAEDGVLFRNYQPRGLTLSEIVDTTLRMSTLGLIDIYEQAQLDKKVNLLVVVDQFEELFRYRQLSASKDVRVSGINQDITAFVNLLLEATEQTTYPIYVVLTMRSDFLGDCAQFPGLAEAINEGQYLVPRMTRDDRRAAIYGPVGQNDAKITPVLLTRLVNDVGDNPDQLSILQHALNRTWARFQSEGGSTEPVNRTHYESIGTMANALDRHAEKAYAELDTERQKQICQKIFRALTDKATDSRGIRRPTTLRTLCALTDATEAEVTEVIDVFRKPSRSFLMPPAGEKLEAETVIDISHESLMRVWRRLTGWANDETVSARRLHRLAETGKLHADGKAALWGDPDLQLALAWRTTETPNETWASRYGGGFDEGMSFLDKSKEVRDRVTAEHILNHRWRIPRGFIAALVLGLYFGFGRDYGGEAWGRVYGFMDDILPNSDLAYFMFQLFHATAHFSLFAGLAHVGKKIYRYALIRGIRKDIANDLLSIRVIDAPKASYAPFWRRFLAGLIDLVVWYTCFMSIGILLFEVLDLDDAGWMIAVVLFGPFFLYDVLMTSSSRQATLGQMALGIFVTDMNGNRVSFLRATARHVLRFFLFFGVLIQPFTAKKQALHDMVTRCVVNYLPQKYRRTPGERSGDPLAVQDTFSKI